VDDLLCEAERLLLTADGLPAGEIGFRNGIDGSPLGVRDLLFGAGGSLAELVIYSTEWMTYSAEPMSHSTERQTPSPSGRLTPRSEWLTPPNGRLTP